MLIVTNIRSFPRQWTAHDGTAGRSELALTTSEFLKHRHRADTVFLVNCDGRLALELAAARAVPFRRNPALIALDLVFLRKPTSIPGRLASLAKRFLLRHVDYFLHYFRNVRPLDSAYGIDAGRSGFVDFKANLWNARSDKPEPDGDYVLCFGRSLRDFDTFFEAVRRVGYPAAIAEPQFDSLYEHGSRFTLPLSALPPNVRILPDDHTEASQIAAIRDARIVVVPMVRGRLIGAGISTIVNAMALGKCVIATEGPGADDVFSKELLSVPPEDPAELATAIDKLWSDADLRRATAQAGWEYAQRCGSEHDFNRRVIDAVVDWKRNSGSR
jgi:glycosyltransferase involved in cell wall biosynthesis